MNQGKSRSIDLLRSLLHRFGRLFCKLVENVNIPIRELRSSIKHLLFVERSTVN